MNGIEALAPQPQAMPDKAKQIAMSGDPQAIMSALSGQAGVDPYKVLAQVKRQADQQQTMQAQMGNQAIQQAQNTPQTTIAQELVGQLSGGIGAMQPQQPQRFANGGSVDSFVMEPGFIKFLQDQGIGGGWTGQYELNATPKEKLQELYKQYKNRDNFFGMTELIPNPFKDQYQRLAPPNMAMPDMPTLPIPEVNIQESKQGSSGGAGVAPIRNKFMLKPYETQAPQLALPEEMTPEQIRAVRDKLSEKDNAEFDAAMSPLAKRRQEMYERQKAGRPTGFDNAVDGILGADVRGRRLGSGLAAMAGGGRRAQREADKAAEQQDLAQLQAEELMARARIEARKGNREEAARLLETSRRMALESLGVKNDQSKLNTAAANTTAANRQDVDKWGAEFGFKVDSENRRNALEGQRITEMRRQRDEDKVEKLYIKAMTAAQNDDRFQKAAAAADQARKFLTQGQATPQLQAQLRQAEAQMEAVKNEYLRGAGVASTLPTQPSASASSATTRFKFNPATSQLE